jgi:septum formation protein
MFPPAPRLILASGSPRRAELLAQIGVFPEIAPPDVDESPVPGESAAAMVERLALHKARSAAASMEVDDRATYVVAGDTTVLVDQDFLGKPDNVADARRMLQQLSGRDHHVVGGVAVVQVGGRFASAIDVTTVTFRALNPDDIEWYVGTGEPMGKAGGYAIQGYGSYLVDRLEGSYSNVVGLPIRVLDDLLTGFDLTLRALARLSP